MWEDGLPGGLACSLELPRLVTFHREYLQTFQKETATHSPHISKRHNGGFAPTAVWVIKITSHDFGSCWSQGLYPVISNSP